MNKLDLYESFSALDEDLLARSEQTSVRKQHTWVKWTALAACLAVAVLAAVPALQKQETPVAPPVPDSGENTVVERDPGPIDMPPAQIVPGFDLPEPVAPTPGPIVPTPGPAEPPPAPVAPLPAFTFNDLREFQFLAAGKPMEVITFTEALTEEELAALLSETLPFWGQPTEGRAVYETLQGILARVLVGFELPCGVPVTLALSRGGDAYITGCIVDATPPERMEWEHEGATLCAWEEPIGDYYYLVVELQRGGLLYRFSLSPETDKLALAKAELPYLVIPFVNSVKLPDLSILHMHEQHVFRSDDLTMPEALADEDFGRWMPRESPAGFEKSMLRRYQNDNMNELFASWNDGGYRHLTWRISYGEAADFALEDLTPDTLDGYTSYAADAGDIDGPRIFFTVRCGGCLVEVSAKGVEPAWLYAQLESLR